MSYDSVLLAKLNIIEILLLHLIKGSHSSPSSLVKSKDIIIDLQKKSSRDLETLRAYERSIVFLTKMSNK